MEKFQIPNFKCQMNVKNQISNVNNNVMVILDSTYPIRYLLPNRVILCTKRVLHYLCKFVYFIRDYLCKKEVR